MSKYVKYSDLAKLATDYARRMNRLSNRIFSEPVRPTSTKSMKIIKLFSAKPMNMDTYIHPYYPRHIETAKLMTKLRHYGLFRDEHEDFKEEMERMRKLRGKGKRERIPKNDK